MIDYESEDVRTLRKWLNEESTAPIDRQALARVLAAIWEVGAANMTQVVPTAEELHEAFKVWWLSMGKAPEYASSRAGFLAGALYVLPPAPSLGVKD